MTKNPPHRNSTIRTRDILASMIPSGWSVWSQEAITLPTSEPEPDAVVVRGGLDRYPDRHPGPEDVALVVEVADATLERDRNLKKRLYAHAGIATYWIVDLIQKRLEVFTDPSGASDQPDYGHQQEFAPDDEVPVVIEGRQVGRIRIRDLLP